MVDRRNTDGPQRATQVEAQVDLDRARQSASRGDMLTFLASLAQQLRGEAPKSQDLEASQPSGSSSVAQPVAEVGEASASESGRHAIDSFGQRQGTMRKRPAQSDEPSSHNESKRNKTARCAPAFDDQRQISDATGGDTNPSWILPEPRGNACAYAPGFLLSVPLPGTSASMSEQAMLPCLEKGGTYTSVNWMENFHEDQDELEMEELPADYIAVSLSSSTLPR